MITLGRRKTLDPMGSLLCENLIGMTTVPLTIVTSKCLSKVMVVVATKCLLKVTVGLSVLLLPTGVVDGKNILPQITGLRVSWWQTALADGKSTGRHLTKVPAGVPLRMIRSQVLLGTRKMKFLVNLATI